MNEKIDEFIDRLLFENFKYEKGKKSKEILLCGGIVGKRDLSGKYTIRHRLFENLENETRALVRLAETIFEENDSQSFQADLLVLENFFAILVDRVVLICESPGSIAELGVFVSDEAILHKLLLAVKKDICKAKRRVHLLGRGR